MAQFQIGLFCPFERDHSARILMSEAVEVACPVL